MIKAVMLAGPVTGPKGLVLNRCWDLKRLGYENYVYTYIFSCSAYILAGCDVIVIYIQ